jgi:hypothetical protein
LTPALLVRGVCLPITSRMGCTWPVAAPSVCGCITAAPPTSTSSSTPHQVDLEALERTLKPLGFVPTLRASGTLRMRLGQTKVEFLPADEARPQERIAPPEEIARVLVAALEDLMATKLKVLGERQELRDYFDVMKLETLGGTPLAATGPARHRKGAAISGSETRPGFKRLLALCS